jgi:hypothetical protein
MQANLFHTRVRPLTYLHAPLWKIRIVTLGQPFSDSLGNRYRRRSAA